MCNENRTKYVYPVPAGMRLGTVFGLYANVAQECPRVRIALALNDIVMEIDGKTTLSALEQRYADYQSRRQGDPGFSGDVMPGDRLVMRNDSDILTDRYRFGQHLG